MITKKEVDWAEIVLDSGFGHPQEVRNAMEIVRLYKVQCEAEKARLEKEQSR